MSKKTLIGKVVSDKMQKTIVVEVERKVAHPVYKKIITKTKKFKADTNGMEAKMGETVKIEQATPMSRDKKFKLIEVIKEGGKTATK